MGYGPVVGHRVWLESSISIPFHIAALTWYFYKKNLMGHRHILSFSWAMSKKG